MDGDRLSCLVDLESVKLAAAVVLLSPYVPLLFMGEEYAEDCPFLYFVSHTDPQLIEAVRQGRQREFESFRWSGPCPDPQSMETFIRSRLDWDKRSQSHHRIIWTFYQRLMTLRKALTDWVSKKGLRVRSLGRSQILVCHRHETSVDLQWVANFSCQVQSVGVRAPEGTWNKVLDSADPVWLGPGSSVPDRITGDQVVAMAPRSVAVFTWDHGPEACRVAAARAEVSLV